MDNIEIGKYYKINPNKYYYCITIQRRVKLEEPVIVKVEHKSCFGQMFFGKLVQHDDFHGDIDTETELEFDDIDIIEEHKYKEYTVPLFYMDIDFKLNKYERTY